MTFCQRFRRAHAALVLILGGLVVPLVASAKPYVCMETNLGEYCMELLPEAAPNTVANFLRYVDSGRYTDSMIHRSVPGFVVQGGGYTIFSNSIGLLTTDAPVVNEYNQSNLRGTVAMARLGGQVNSATSQWFVNLSDSNTFLDTVDGGFTVFAKVVSGMDVVDAIAALNRYDFRSALGAAFGEVPSTAPPNTLVELSQLIRVQRAYQTDSVPGLLLPWQCSPASPGDTLTEFCGSTLSFPVMVGGVLYEATLAFLPGRSGLVFAVDRNTLKPLADTGQARASFAADVLTIPSVRKGASAFTNVKLRLTNRSELEFTLESFTPR